MPRGGRRTPTPGREYANRRDLNQPAKNAALKLVAPATPQEPFGSRAQREQQQAALPMGAPAAPPAGGGAPSPFTQLVPLDAPTQRPDEPVTAGSPSGAGPGPATPPPAQTTQQLVVQLAEANPSPELAQLLDYVTTGRG